MFSMVIDAYKFLSEKQALVKSNCKIESRKRAQQTDNCEVKVKKRNMYERMAHETKADLRWEEQSSTVLEEIDSEPCIKIEAEEEISGSEPVVEIRTASLDSGVTFMRGADSVTIDIRPTSTKKSQHPGKTQLYPENPEMAMILKGLIEPEFLDIPKQSVQDGFIDTDGNLVMFGEIKLPGTEERSGYVGCLDPSCRREYLNDFPRHSPVNTLFAFYFDSQHADVGTLEASYVGARQAFHFVFW